MSRGRRMRLSGPAVLGAALVFFLLAAIPLPRISHGRQAAPLPGADAAPGDAREEAGRVLRELRYRPPGLLVGARPAKNRKAGRHDGWLGKLLALGDNWRRPALPRAR